MSSYTARMKIPVAWAEKGHCPICDKTTLYVVHPTGQPDQLACVSCDCSFEIETDGPNIRLTWIGPDYRQKLQAADGSWMSVMDIRRQLIQPARQDKPEVEMNPIDRSVGESNRTSNTSVPEDAKDSVQTPELNQEEVTRRAIGLAELGNKPASIRSTLIGSGISDELVTIALEEVKSRKIKRKSPLPLVLAVTIIVVVGCLSGAAIYLPKVNIMALIGPITGSLNVFNSPRTNAVSTPISAGTGLPADGGQYFNVIWNLTGSYNEKANLVDSVIPPAGLELVHKKLVDSLRKTGSLEEDYKKCQVEYDEKKCYEAQANGDSYCGTKAMECSKANLLFLQEQTTLYSLWLGTGCKAFEEYYSANNVEFPFPQGNCNYP